MALSTWYGEDESAPERTSLSADTGDLLPRCEGPVPKETSVLSNCNPYVVSVPEFFPADETADTETKSGNVLIVFALGLQPGEELIVGQRLRKILKQARASTSS